jgi:predicted dehydrogenase
MRVLVVGLGSIAKKHIEAIKKIDSGSELYALRSGTTNTDFDDVPIANLFSWDEVPDNLDFILITNPTSEHYETILKACRLCVPLFIEKPPCMTDQQMGDLLQRTELSNIQTYIAFNLRFHPILNWIKENIIGKRVIEVQAYCGSYLPDWRKGTDYRKQYSSEGALGGGVHLDLIHELDYVRWIFGNPLNVISYKSKVSDLEINSTDCAYYHLQYENKCVSVLLNYYRRDSKRTLEIVFDDDSWMANLLSGEVVNSHGECIFKTENKIADTYQAQMAYFITCLKQNIPLMNDLRESSGTLKICLS